MATLTQQQIQEAIRNLHSILSQGAGSTSVAGRSTSYRSTTEILDAIRLYEGMLEDSQTPSNRARFIQFTYRDD